MILKAFCLLDMKAGAFAQPFFMHHDAQAVRAVTELGQDLNTTVGRYPSDFALCSIGTFDDSSGVLTPTGIINLGTVAGFLPSKPAMPLFAAADAVRLAPGEVSRMNGQHGPSVGVDRNGEVM